MGEKKNVERMEQEVLEWQERQVSFRKKYSFTPAGFGDPRAAINAETNLQKAKHEYQNRNNRCILTPYEPKAEGFVGRKAYLEQLDIAMKQGKPVVLYGIGGIGKTSLAREYVRKVQESKTPFDLVVFLSCNTSMEALICDDRQLTVSNLCYSRDKYGSQAAYFRKKIKVLQEICSRKKLLFIIDNCNVEKDRRMREVFSLPCSFLITTRMNPRVWEEELFWGSEEESIFSAIEVKEFDTEKEWSDFTQLYQKRSFSEKEKEELQSYRNKVHGHTLFMMLKIRDTDTVGEDLFSGEENIEIVNDLFRCFHLSKNGIQVLCELAIMPLQGIEEELYYELSKVTKKTVNKLVDRLLIRREAGWLSIHPMIAEAVKKVFHPGKKTYKNMIERMRGLIFNAWNQTYLENQRLEPYVFALLEACPVPFCWQHREYDSMITFLWIQGYFEEAYYYCKILLDTVKQYYGNHHQVTGEMTLRLAAAYYNAMDFKTAHEWYVQAYIELKNCEPFDERYAYVYSSAAAKLAREFRYSGEAEKALVLIEEAMEILKQYDDKGRKNIEKKLVTQCHWMIEKARILWDLKQYEEAYQLGNKAKNHLCTLPEEIIQGEISEFDRFLIKTMIKRGDYEEAEKLACSMVERSKVMFQREFKDALSAQEHLADVWKISGKKKKAEETYANILKILKEDYPYQKKWIEQTEEKLKNVKMDLIAEKS